MIRGHRTGPWPHFARSSHARIAAASGSSGDVSHSVRSSFPRLRLVEVTIAGFRSSSAGGAGGKSAGLATRFRTIAGPVIATAAYRFFGGRLGR